VDNEGVVSTLSLVRYIFSTKTNTNTQENPPRAGSCGEGRISAGAAYIPVRAAAFCGSFGLRQLRTLVSPIPVATLSVSVTDAGASLICAVTDVLRCLRRRTAGALFLAGAGGALPLLSGGE
jgi:hypothetical protein